MKRHILFVDDNQSVLTIFQHVIKFMHQDWEASFCMNGHQALTLMARRPFDCVISDISMPVMGGVDFLAEVEKKYPATARFVFSGETDRGVGLQLVGTAHQFFQKPSDFKQIKTAIERVYSLFQYLPEDNLKQIIGHIQVLPTLPDLYLQMTSELEKPEPSIDRIKTIISQDVAMSAKLLQVVNSAFFGLRQALTNPAQAVTMLGLNLVKSIVLMLHVFQEHEMIRFEGLTLNSLWRHSLSTAQNARDLALHEGMSSSLIEHIGSAALFHDIGKLVLMANVPAEYEKVYRRVRAERSVMSEVELEMLGASHGQVGAYLLGLWGFDDMYVNVCRFHHTPEMSGESEVGPVCLVHAADVFDHIMEPNESGEKPLVLDEAYLAKIGTQERVTAWKKMILKDNPIV